MCLENMYKRYQPTEKMAMNIFHLHCQDSMSQAPAVQGRQVCSPGRVKVTQLAIPK